MGKKCERYKENKALKVMGRREMIRTRTKHNNERAKKKRMKDNYKDETKAEERGEFRLKKSRDLKHTPKERQG